MKIGDEELLHELNARILHGDEQGVIARALNELLAARKVVEAYRVLNDRFSAYVCDVREDWSAFDGRDLSKTWSAETVDSDIALAAYDAAVSSEPTALGGDR